MAVSTWLPALFGLLGTAFGATATTIGHRISVAQQARQAELTRAQQDRQAEAARAQHLADVRHEAAVVMLARVDALLDDLRELRRAVGDAARRESVEVVHSRYLERWGDFMSTRAGVRVAGPEAVSTAGGDLREALAHMAELVDAWHHDRRAPSEDHYDSAYGAACAEREKFAEVARTILDPRPGVVATVPRSGRHS